MYHPSQQMLLLGILHQHIQKFHLRIYLVELQMLFQEHVQRDENLDLKPLGSHPLHKELLLYPQELLG